MSISYEREKCEFFGDLLPGREVPLEEYLKRRETTRIWVEVGDGRDPDAHNWYPAEQKISKNAQRVNVKTQDGAQTPLELVRHWDEEGLRGLSIEEFAQRRIVTATVKLVLPDVIAKIPNTPRMLITEDRVFSSVRTVVGGIVNYRDLENVLSFMHQRFEGINPVSCPDIPINTMHGNPPI